MQSIRAMRITAIVLVLLLAGSLWWGYGQYQLRRSFNIQLENSYQRAFHELVYNMKTVENELAMLSAANGVDQQMQKLSTVSRQAYSAQEKVGQLPLGLVPLDETEAYLKRVGDYVSSLASKGSALGQAEKTSVLELQQSAGKIGDQLAALQSTILQKNIRWTDVQAALVKAKRQDEVRDNTVIDGLQLVNQEVQQFPEIKVDQRVGVALPPPTALGGTKVSQADAQATALWFLSPNDKAAFQVVSVELTKGIIPTYRFVLTTPRADRQVTVEVTEAGGKVFWMFDSRVPSAVQIPNAALTQQSSDWLRRRGYNNLQLVGQHEYQGSVLFAYVFEQNGVLVYPDLLRVRMARDDGSVIGFEGNGYVAYHSETRQLAQPKITVEQALGKLSKGLEQIGPAQLAVIFNANAQETLTYELPVKNATDSFLIYVDAEKGDELQIVRLDPVDLPKQDGATTSTTRPQPAAAPNK